MRYFFIIGDKVALEDPISLMRDLGLTFFIPFLIGIFVGLKATRSVYITIAIALAFGCVGWLIL